MVSPYNSRNLILLLCYTNQCKFAVLNIFHKIGIDNQKICMMWSIWHILAPAMWSYEVLNIRREAFNRLEDNKEKKMANSNRKAALFLNFGSYILLLLASPWLEEGFLGIVATFFRDYKVWSLLGCNQIMQFYLISWKTDKITWNV